MRAPSAPGALESCEICDTPNPTFRWTDSHGVGACRTCGAAYRILHYDGDKRVEGQPTLTLKPEWVDLHRRAFAELQHNIMPGAHNMPGSSYEVATREEARAVNAWFEAHKGEWPPDSAGTADGGKG